MTYTRRVQFYETDAQGVVHHSNYFRYFEEARGEYLKEMGMPYSSLRSMGYEVVLIHAGCEYKKPLKYDEVVDIELRVKEVNRFTFEFHYIVRVRGEERARGITKHCMVRNGKIVSIPGELRDKLCSGLY